MKRPQLPIALALAAFATSGCTRVPSHVISPDDMAELMADIHVGEAVVESNYSHYTSDSSRQALKQAILKRHNVSQDELDTSMVWYGHHLDIYQDVYEHTEQILQDRLDNSAAIIAAQSAMSLSGDSVDIWSQGRRMAFSPSSATNIITFSVKPDRNTQKGDTYTWRGKFFNVYNPVRWGIVATYSDGTTETYITTAQNDGWASINFVTDSTLTINAINGYMIVSPKADRGAVYVDSLQLVRNRLNRDTYLQRYRQRAYKL